MPEVSELVLTSHYLESKIKNKTITNVKIVSGKYLRKKIKHLDLLTKNKYKIKEINSHGKVIWFKLQHSDNIIYLVSHLGLTGGWRVGDDKDDNNEDSENSDIRIEFDIDKDKKLYYYDTRNFGNIEIFTSHEDFNKRIDKLAPDVLKTEFSDDDFISMIEEFLSKSSKRKDQLLFKVLTNQNKSNGLFSGLGNYLTAEILYDAKLSPYRKIGSLTKTELKTLSHSIKYITKLSYNNNEEGYMTKFNDFIKKHKEGVDDGKYPDYHKDIKIKKKDKFSFKVYRQKEDPLGNPVYADKELNQGRTTYWVKRVQK